MKSRPIRAGGGVVLRWHGEHVLQVLIIHRPKYDDWSHPKGKCEGDEKFIEAAVREVEEETGLVTVLGPKLSPVSYPSPGGRVKRVKYWVMWPADGRGVIQRLPDDEVDDLVWVQPTTALDLLTHEHDQLLLKEAIEVIDQ